MSWQIGENYVLEVGKLQGYPTPTIDTSLVCGDDDTVVEAIHAGSE